MQEQFQKLLVGAKPAHTTPRQPNTSTAGGKPWGCQPASPRGTPARTQQTTNGAIDRSQMPCYNCQSWGHMWHECRSARNICLAQSLNSGRGKQPQVLCLQPTTTRIHPFPTRPPKNNSRTKIPQP